jgi:acid phosphatase
MTTNLRLWHLATLATILIANACAHAPHSRESAGNEPQNLGLRKAELIAYHDRAYSADLAAIATVAERYVLARAPQVKNPALVLDIDETALSNWTVLVADDFGYFAAGGCDFLPKGPCGWIEWDKLGRATAIEPTRRLFDTARAAGVKIFFVTGRRETEREWTEHALFSAGYTGWEALVMKPVALDVSAAAYKSAARADIEAKGFTIVANVGDQQSDLDGGHAERGFKLPNPYYYIP